MRELSAKRNFGGTEVHWLWQQDDGHGLRSLAMVGTR